MFTILLCLPFDGKLRGVRKGDVEILEIWGYGDRIGSLPDLRHPLIPLLTRATDLCAKAKIVRCWLDVSSWYRF